VAEDFPLDPFLKMPVKVTFIQPYQAVKDYVCPSCNQTITAGTGHVVIVPVEAADLRRHWHKACWQHREKRHKRRG
jgi:hypothetical protein